MPGQGSVPASRPPSTARTSRRALDATGSSAMPLTLADAIEQAEIFIRLW